jgi:hypothetical protein
MAEIMTSMNQLGDPSHPGMVWIPGGTFLWVLTSTTRRKRRRTK